MTIKIGDIVEAIFLYHPSNTTIHRIGKLKEIAADLIVLEPHGDSEITLKYGDSANIVGLEDHHILGPNYSLIEIILLKNG